MQWKQLGGQFEQFCALLRREPAQANGLIHGVSQRGRLVLRDFTHSNIEGSGNEMPTCERGWLKMISSSQPANLSHSRCADGSRCSE